MELRQLRTFLAVAEAGGFRRAAARLYLSQPAVSRQVADLERLLGVTLFSRDTHQVVLTTEGAAFAQRAQAIVEECDAAVRAARRERLGGELVLGLLPGGAAELTAPILRHLARALPAVSVRTVSLPLMQWDDRPPPGIDLLLVRDPVSADRARVTVVLDEPLMLSVPPGWPAGNGSALSPDDVARLPLVRFTEATPPRLYAFWSTGSLDGCSPGRFAGQGAVSPESLVLDVVRGVGVAFATASLARWYDASALPLARLEPAPRARTCLTSRLEDDRPLVDAVHREVATVIRQIGPLVLPADEPVPIS